MFRLFLFSNAAISLSHCIAVQTFFSAPRRHHACSFLAHGDILRTMHRGRWSDLWTAKVYVTDSAAQFTSMQMTPQAKAHCRLWLDFSLQLLHDCSASGRIHRLRQLHDFWGPKVVIVFVCFCLRLRLLFVCWFCLFVFVSFVVLGLFCCVFPWTSLSFT